MRRGRWLLRLACHALWTLALAAVSAALAYAQPLVCHAIRPGESAAQAARRVTGDSRNMYSSTFQILNGSSKVVPKSQYDRRLPADWKACSARPRARVAARRDAEPNVVPAVTERETGTDEPVASFRVSAQPAAPIGARPGGTVDLTPVWLGATLAVPWLGLHLLDGYVTRRKTASLLARQFADRFIAEFERPLIGCDDSERPLEARVRSARRGRFDILLAPGPGRRYPNLTDHKRNVEYDVDRVLHAIGDPAFVTGTPYTQAAWVVVPCQPAAGVKQAGVTCISSS
jgi:hypothetical protein